MKRTFVLATVHKQTTHTAHNTHSIYAFSSRLLSLLTLPFAHSFLALFPLQ